MASSARRRFPSVPLALVSLVMVAAGCAEDASDAAVSDPGPVDGPPGSVVVPASGPDSERAPVPSAAVDEQVRSVTVELDVPVEVADSGTVSAAWVGVPAVDAVDGPFGRFGSCSAWREAVSAYSVVVSTGPGGPADDGLSAVLVWTSDRVDGGGVYEADVRLEGGDGTVWNGNGTIRLSDDLRRGDVEASAPDGGVVTGSFECSGPTAPVPVDGSTVVEIFALIRSESAERVLGLVTAESTLARCGGTDAPTSVIASVDAGAGGLSSFELGGEPEPVVRFEAGGRMFEVSGPTLSFTPGGGSGVFSGVTADGVEVDGAYRCP